MIINLAKKMKLKTADKVCREDITINPLLQTKTATENGIIVQDAGYVGLGKVEVDVSTMPCDTLDKPLLPKFGNVKYFANGRSEVGYMRLAPFVTNIGTFVASGETSLASNNSAEEATGLRRSRSNQMINLNGKRYTATDVGSVMGFVENVSAHGNQATVPDIVIPPFVLRTVTAYNGTNEQFIEEMGADSKTSSVYESGGAIAYHHAMFAVTESGTILCLAVDAIYPRVDIAMAGSVTSYEYSLDDGITWEAATEGFVFRQVEHVMLRNAGGSTIHIGTSEGANDICTLTSNQYVAYSTENTTWYVSEEA